MSKLGGGFWAAGASSDEDDVDNEADHDQGPAIVQTGRTTGRFQMSGSSSGEFIANTETTQTG